MRLQGSSRFKRAFKRLSSQQQKVVADALDVFTRDPENPLLDFKLRTGSRYHSIRAGKRSDNLRIAMRATDEPDLFTLELVGNHDDLNSLDHQKR